ncbi:MAG: hypothetical protein MK078_09995 [Crocinitomicaceae bacterium]|nr:hypothetical protein [Crocinitomicaceae bacterium]
MRKGIIAIGLFCFGCNNEPPAPAAQANFFAENNGCIAPCYIYFYDASINAVKWEYTFDNGFTSEFPDDSTQYISQRDYNVKLKVWNIDNVADSVSKVVTIYE